MGDACSEVKVLAQSQVPNVYTTTTTATNMSSTAATASLASSQSPALPSQLHGNLDALKADRRQQLQQQQEQQQASQLTDSYSSRPSAAMLTEGSTGINLLYIYGSQLNVQIGIILAQGISAVALESQVTKLAPAIEANLENLLGVGHATLGTPTASYYSAACQDGAQSPGETDVDCGGSTGCARCMPNKKCVSNSDCYSLDCGTGNVCMRDISSAFGLSAPSTLALTVSLAAVVLAGRFLQ